MATTEQQPRQQPSSLTKVDVKVVNIATGISSSDRNNQLKQPIQGTDRLEPTRYGDWEKNGRCIDF